jgi:hypothetical protein
MSKKRNQAESNQNKFRVFLQSAHADVLEIPMIVPQGVEPEAIDPGVIDIEAQEVVDRAALSSASVTPKALPSSESATKPLKSPGRPRHPKPKPKNPNPPGQRGRPATGKRSNVDWQGRTFYIRKRTDDVLTSALFKLKRSGIALDKSELVDALLEAWAEITLEDISDFQIGEIVEKRLKKSPEPEES